MSPLISKKKEATIKYLQSTISIQDRIGLSYSYKDILLDSAEELPDHNFIDLNDSIDKNNLVALVGIAGSGKTSILKRLEYDRAQKYIQHKEGFIPLFISARTIQSKNLTSCGYLIQEITNQGIPKSSAEKFLLDGNIIFIVDALDEINTSAQKSQFKDIFLTLINKYPLCKFVFSSRNQADFEFINKEYSIFTLLALNPSQISNFTKSYLSSHDIKPDIKKELINLINSYGVDFTNPRTLNMSLNTALNYKSIIKNIQKNSKLNANYHEDIVFTEKNEMGIDFLKYTDKVSFQKTVDHHMLIINQFYELIPENSKAKQDIGNLIEMTTQENDFQYQLPVINLILSQMKTHFGSIEKREQKSIVPLIEAIIAICVGLIAIYSFFFK